jgi:hypothetical protein
MGGIEISSRGYLVRLGALISAMTGLIIVFISLIDPFGLAPISMTIEGINTTKIVRNTSDRLIKPYDAFTVRPKTVIVGTSRVKQAFDPDFVNAAFAPAYNAGIDALTVREARQLLEGYLRNGLPIEHVFMEVFLYQFRTVKWPDAGPLAGDDRISDTIATTFSLFALRASIDTIKASLNPTTAITRRNGYRQAGDNGHPGPGFVSLPKPAARAPSNGAKQTKATSLDHKATSFDDYVFVELDKIIALCVAHGIDLKFFIAPIHPALAYMLGVELVPEWLTRLSARPGVLSFLTAKEFRDGKLDEPKKYYADSSHLTVHAARLIIDFRVCSTKRACLSSSPSGRISLMLGNNLILNSSSHFARRRDYSPADGAVLRAPRLRFFRLRPLRICQGCVGADCGGMVRARRAAPSLKFIGVCVI